jgi:hypothetical protein
MDTQLLIARRDEMGAIEALLDRTGPRGRLLEGEAGIGKTSAWSAGVDFGAGQRHDGAGRTPGGRRGAPVVRRALGSD